MYDWFGGFADRSNNAQRLAFRATNKLCMPVDNHLGRIDLPAAERPARPDGGARQAAGPAGAAAPERIKEG